MSTNQSEQPTIGEKLRGLLRDFPTAPSTETIDSFKATHGDIFLSALTDDEVFIFRTLTRREHRKLTSDINQGIFPPESLEEQVVDFCVLWKSITDLELKAGTIPSLFEQIMQNSNFLAPQLLSNLVTKL